MEIVAECVCHKWHGRDQTSTVSQTIRWKAPPYCALFFFALLLSVPLSSLTWLPDTSSRGNKPTWYFLLRAPRASTMLRAAWKMAQLIFPLREPHDHRVVNCWSATSVSERRWKFLMLGGPRPARSRRTNIDRNRGLKDATCYTCRECTVATIFQHSIIPPNFHMRSHVNFWNSIVFLILQNFPEVPDHLNNITIGCS